MSMILLDRAVEPCEIVGALRRYDLTQKEVASSMGLTPRAVRKWRPDTPVRRTSEKRVQHLRLIVLLLDDSLTPRGVGQWFRAHNRLLGGRRPLDVLAQGDFEAVRQAAEAFADGGYV